MSGAEVEFLLEEDEFYNRCPRCHSRRILKVIHGMPMFRDEFNQSIYAARDNEGQWHYRTAAEYDAERRLAHETGVAPAGPRLHYSHYYGTAEGALYEIAGCCIEFGDPSVYLNSTCRSCGLLFGYDEDQRSDELGDDEEDETYFDEGDED